MASNSRLRGGNGDKEIVLMSQNDGSSTNKRSKQSTRSVSAVEEDELSSESVSLRSRSRGSKFRSQSQSSQILESSNANTRNRNSASSSNKNAKSSDSRPIARNKTKVRVQRLKDVTEPASDSDRSCKNARDSVSDSDSDNMSEGDRECAKCDGIVNDNVKALRCEFCTVWVCLHCTEVPESMYDLMMDKEVPNVIWTCDSCIHALPTIKKLGKTLQGVKDEQISCKKDISKLNEKVDKLESSIDVKVQDAINDYRNREARKCNIIIHNVPESNKENPKDRMKDDTVQVMDMIEGAMELETANINSAIRLGKKDSEGRVRLLKVTVDSVKSKREILINAKKLRGIGKWKNIFVTPDLAPKERQQNKELREELKKRREDGEDGLVIRRGKITHIHNAQHELERGIAEFPASQQSFR